MEHRSQQLNPHGKDRPTARLPYRANRRGVALLIVLSSLALIALLVIALLLSINSELATSSSSAANSQTSSLAADATQLVMAQIRDGTSEGSTSNSGRQYAWASQPGMIRTYNNNSADPTQNPDKCYKLYSSDQMVVDGKTYESDLPANGPTADSTANWYSAPGIFTDLNAPVQDSTGALNYPILDPSGLSTYAGAQAPYILGFAVNNAPTGTSTSSKFQNPIPMPVKWLYVRQNGFVTAATAGSGSSVTVQQDPNYTGTAPNPIVGRMAFWTDDETCKVNINTAGEGLYWDTPRATANLTSTTTPTSPPSSTANDIGQNNDVESFYSFFQPATHELQRYPGHPAMVALSPILGPGFATSIYNSALYPGPSGLFPTFPPTPRLSSLGGSQLGTVPYNPAPAVINYANAARKALYASLDEFFFSNLMSGSTREATDFRYYTKARPTTDGATGASITKASLEAAKFFLTADSRAPEVNMFNLPRIACWPIDSSLTPGGTSVYTSGYDRLIAFCSSLKQGGTTPEPYYFQRSRVNDGSETNYDWDSIARNQTLYSYLQYLTSLSIPGFGGQSFSTKYSGTGSGGATDLNQLLTETFDYIRCTNPNDASLAIGNQYIGNHANFTTTSTQWIKPIYNSSNGTMGFGRTFTVREVGIQLVCCGDASVTPNAAHFPAPYLTGSPSVQSANNPNNWDGNDPTDNLMLNGVPLTAGQKRYQAAIFFRVQCVSPGNAYPDADLFLQCTGIKSFSFAGASVSNPFTNVDSLSNVVKFSSFSGNGAGYEGPGQITDPRTMFNGTNWSPANCFYDPTRYYNSPSTLPTPSYFFISVPFTVSNGSAPLAFSGGNFTVNLYEASGHSAPTSAPSATSLIQTLNLHFPAGNLPAPSLDVGAPVTTAASPSTNGPLDDAGVVPTGGTQKVYRYAADWGFNRLPGVNQGPVSSYGTTWRNSLYNPNDVLVSISAANGDVRLIAGSRTLNDSSGSMFIPRSDSPWSYSSSAPFSCFFPNFLGGGATPASGPVVANSAYQWTSGRLINYTGSSSQSTFTADVPTVFTAANTPMTTGDWDNIPGNEAPPGSFINKPDEGDSTINNVNYVPYFDTGSGNATNSTINSGNNLLANYVTPNRIIPSPGMFGSLPTGVASGKPWQTLLFRPDRTHPESDYDINGNASHWPPDHLYMDLFWMPQVEPYAISDCFSTAGKINMNYQIVPFTYITRNTALYALIHGGTNGTTKAASGEKLFFVPNTKTLATVVASGQAVPTFYKSTANLNQFTNFSFRSDINCGDMTWTSTGVDPVGEVGGTFRQFKARFNAGDIFRSPSEICDIYLVPKGLSWTNGGANWAAGPDGETFWDRKAGSYQATGDNDRERPYTDLYGRLTTKSNTFLVHMRVQSLKQNRNEAITQWTEGTDTVTGEYRGSSLIERYIDPADPNLVDYASGTNSGTSGPTLNDLYKFRIVYNKKFAP